MWENGHSTNTVLGLTSSKSNTQPQNGRYGVLIPFQPLIEGCFDCVGSPSRENLTALKAADLWQKLMAKLLGKNKNPCNM